MCIRDSRLLREQIEKDNDKAKDEKLNPVRLIDIGISVSYTHLDVYKRQQCGCPRCVFAQGASKAWRTSCHRRSVSYTHRGEVAHIVCQPRYLIIEPISLRRIADY